MPQQVHATRPTATRRTEEVAVAATPVASDHVTVDEVDALLDEIDEVLEENALEVVQMYRQRGGQ